MRRLMLAFILAALVLPLVPSPSRALPAGGMYGGDLVVALQAAPSLDPTQFAQNSVVQAVAYDSLVRLGPDQTPLQSLATSWAVNVPARAITMTLRTATWPDNTAITAQDVAWTFGKYATANMVTGVTPVATSATTVQFTFTSGGGDFLGNAATFPIAWKNLANAYTTNGPFILGSQNATTIRLVANDRHWGGRPYLDSVTFASGYTLVKNADDSTQGNDAACALLKGTVSLIGWPLTQTDTSASRDCAAGFGGWSNGVNRTLGQSAGIKEEPGLQFLYLGINAQRAPLTDPTLRRALTMAIDRDLIVGTYGNPIESKTDIADSPVNQANAAWFNASVPRYRVPRTVQGPTASPDLTQVNAFLDAAGYLDRDGDGYRDTPAGTPFNFTLLTYNQATDPKVAKYADLVTKFHSIGINVQQQEHPPADLRAIVASDAFDLFVDIQDARGDPAFLSEILHTGSARNVVNLASPALDAILDRTRDALDPAVRHQAVLDAEGWIGRQVPLAPILYYRAVHAYNRTAYEGWIEEIGGIVNFWTFAALHVTQRGRLTVTMDPLLPTVRSGEGTDVLVRARDADDNPVAGVDLEFSGAGLADTTGTTNVQGEFTTHFDAPSVSAPNAFPLNVSAAKAGYEGANAAASVTVNPLVRAFVVTVTKVKATIGSGEVTTVRVSVIDEETASPVAGATVAFSMNPSGLGASVTPSSGATDSTGFFQADFTGDVAVQSRFVVTATVAAAGFEDAQATTTIEVSAHTAAPVTPGLDTISMVAIVAALAALYGARQRRKWLEQKP